MLSISTMCGTSNCSVDIKTVYVNYFDEESLVTHDNIPIKNKIKMSTLFISNAIDLHSYRKQFDLYAHLVTPYIQEAIEKKKKLYMMSSSCNNMI